MLYLMRNKMKSVVMWFIIGAFLMTIFYAWGVGSARRGKRDQSWIAKVGAEKISTGEYERELQQLQEQFRNLPPELVKTLNLKQKALEVLISRRLLLLQAEKMGVEVPDRELAQSIQQVPVFQENGVFSSRAYRQALAQYYRLTPASFEERQRENLKIQKVQDLVEDTAKVSEQEVHEAFLLKNEKVVIEYALLRAEEHRPDRAVTEKEAQHYYEEHKANFRTKETRNILFAYLTPQEFFDEITLPKGEAEQFYKRNRSDYVRPERVRARHILIRVPRDADKSTVQAAREKIEGILKKAKAGEDFGKLARKYSEDSSASRGGDLGYFERGQMVAGFEKAAFSLKPGEISDIVRSKFGFHIIQVEDHQERKEEKFEDVRAKIEGDLKFDQGMHLARRKAMRLYAEIRKGKDFRKALEEAKFPVRETGYFSRADDRILGVPADLERQFNEEAFAVGEGGVGSVIRGDRGYILLKVLKRKPPEIPPLVDVSQEVNRAVLKELAKSNAQKAADKMVKALKEKVPFTEAAEQAEAAETKTTDPFTRADAPVTPEFTKTAFDLSANNPAAATTTKEGTYVLFLKEKIPADDSAYEKAKPEIRQSLMAEKKKALLTAWLDRLRKESAVEVQQALLDRI